MRRGCHRSIWCFSDEIIAVTMRIGATWVVGFWIAVCPASSQESNTTEQVRKGHHLASMLCASCHIAARDQPYKPTLDPPAASFESIAQRKDVNAASLQNFLNTTHQGLDSPKGMPFPNLADFQVKAIVSYILSLRK